MYILNSKNRKFLYSTIYFVTALSDYIKNIICNINYVSPNKQKQNWIYKNTSNSNSAITGEIIKLEKVFS